MLKNRILFLLKIPPPITGATIMNKFVYDSVLLKRSFDLQRIDIHYATSANDLGKNKLGKIGIFLKTYIKFLNSLFVYRPKFIYFQPSIFGFVYYRDLVFLMTGRILGLRFLLHLHGKGIADVAAKSKIKKKLYELGFSKQFLIVLCENQKSDIDFAKPEKIFIVPNGIPDSARPSDLTTATESKFRFLFISNLFISKGIYDLIDAVVKLKEHNDQFVVDVVGAEGDINTIDLELVLKKNKIEQNVFIHGANYNDEKYAYYEKANVLIYPTHLDLMPLVILEAMQFSLPVIATKEGAIVDLVYDGKTGFVIDKGDIVALTDKMKYFMDNRSMAENMGRNGRKVYEEKFTLEKFENNMLNTFNEVLRMQT